MSYINLDSNYVSYMHQSSFPSLIFAFKLPFFLLNVPLICIEALSGPLILPFVGFVSNPYGWPFVPLPSIALISFSPRLETNTFNTSSTVMILLFFLSVHFAFSINGSCFLPLMCPLISSDMPLFGNFPYFNCLVFTSKLLSTL